MALGIRRRTRALVRRIGHRGAALLFFALLDAVYAFSLFNPPATARVSGQMAFMEAIAPLSVWGAMWAVAGAVCLVCAFRSDDRWGYAAAMLVKVLWGALYVYGAVSGVERAYLGAVIWFCLAGWIAIISSWPTPPDMAIIASWPTPPDRQR